MRTAAASHSGCKGRDDFSLALLDDQVWQEPCDAGLDGPSLAQTPHEDRISRSGLSCLPYMAAEQLHELFQRLRTSLACTDMDGAL